MTRETPLPKNDPDALRRRAEKTLRDKQRAPENLSHADMQEAISELRVHQIELGIQNEELRRAQSELEESRDRYSDLYDFAPVGYLTLDDKDIIREANLTAAAMLGVERARLLRSRFTSFIARDDRDTFYLFRRRLLEAQTQQTCEVRMVKRGGSEFHAALAALPAQDADGAAGMRLTLSDVTERKQAGESLQKSEEEYRRLFEDSPIALWVEDFSEVKRRLDGLKQTGVRDAAAYFRANPGFVRECAALVRIQDVNSAALKLYHAREKSELLGSLADILATLSHEQFEYELTQIANGRLAFEREETEHTLTGEEIVVSIRCSVAPGYEDSLAKVIVSTLDVTERRRAEQKVRHHLTELEALNRVSTALRIAQTQEEMLPILLDETLAALGCADGVVWLYHPEDGNLRIAAARGWFTRFKDAPLKPGEGIAGNVFASGKIHHSVEFARDPLARVPPGMTIPAGWGGVCVPVHSAAEVTGVIFVSMRLPRQVTPEETKLLESLAEMTGIALHRLALHEETVQRLYQLQALQTIDRAITSSFDLRVSLGVLLEQTITLLKADAADVLTFAPHTQTLDYIAGRGFRSPAAERTQVPVGQGIAGRAALERRTLRTASLKEESNVFPRGGLLEEERIAAFIVAPLIVKGQLLGVLEAFHRAPFHPGDEWLNLFETLAGQAAIAIDNARSFEGLQRSLTELTLAYDTTIEGWSRAMDLRDRETEGHTRRVTEMTLRLARMAGMTSEELLHVKRGALLHDMGKLGVPDSILFKRTKLTAEEWDIMRRHPHYTYEMLHPIQYLRPALDIPYCHHEKWDGTGYPRGLKGSQIPLAARLFAVVDVWDALRSDRPYRKAWSPQKVREYIRAQAGTHFDPQAVELFFQMIEEKGNGREDNSNSRRRGD